MSEATDIVKLAKEFRKDFENLSQEIGKVMAYCLFSFRTGFSRSPATSMRLRTSMYVRTTRSLQNVTAGYVAQQWFSGRRGEKLSAR